MINWNEVIKYANNGNLSPDRRVEKSDSYWKSILTAEQYRITREKGTERAGSGALCSSHDAGKYSCICCNTLLFLSLIHI